MMKLSLLMAAIAAVGCLKVEAPSCSSLGCSSRPSGSPDTWTPCVIGDCWCPTGKGVMACSADVEMTCISRSVCDGYFEVSRLTTYAPDEDELEDDIVDGCVAVNSQKCKLWTCTAQCLPTGN